MYYIAVISISFFLLSIISNLLTNFITLNYEKYKKSTNKSSIIVVERNDGSFAYIDNEKTTWAEGKDAEKALIQLLLKIPDTQYQITYKKEKSSCSDEA